MRRRGFSWIEVVVVLAAAFIMVAVGFAYTRPPELGRRSKCQKKMLQIALAMEQYRADFNDSFPMVVSGGAYYGWADAVQPYLKTSFQCHIDEAWPAGNDGPASPNYTDYFYNSRLEGRQASSLPFIANTIMLGESAPGNARQHSNGGNATKPGSASLVNRTGAPVGSALRHLEGANYAFTDGHTKWLKGKDETTAPAIRNAAGGATSAYPTIAIE